MRHQRRLRSVQQPVVLRVPNVRQSSSLPDAGVITHDITNGTGLQISVQSKAVYKAMANSGKKGFIRRGGEGPRCYLDDKYVQTLSGDCDNLRSAYGIQRLHFT